MSSFPEQLYRKSLRDQLVVGLEPFFVRVAPPAVAAVTVEAQLLLPFDRALLLNNVLVEISAGAAQTLGFMNLLIILSATQVVLLDGFPKEAGAAGPAGGTHLLRSEYSSMMLRPGATLLARGIFSAGAAANFVGLSVGGMLIPRANISAI